MKILQSTILVSVVMTTYNHEGYIAESLNSVLRQTHERLELIVVDDGSTDGTRRIIEAFSDTRIRYFYRENAGPSDAVNFGLGMARGSYLALMSGDDVCEPTRLENELAAARAISGPSIVFTSCSFIDRFGNYLEGLEHPLRCDEDWNSMGAAELLALLFRTGNRLCAPSAFISRSAYRRVGNFSLACLQLQDFDYWLRALVAGVRVRVLPERLMRYRVSTIGGSLSSQTSMAAFRTDLEYYKAFRHFRSLPSGMCSKIFGFEPALGDGVRLDYRIAKSFIAHPNQVWKSFGLSMLFDLAESHGSIRVGDSTIAKEFYRLAGEFPFFPVATVRACLYIDEGEGYSESKSFTVLVDPRRTEIDLLFDLSRYPGIRNLRFDPFDEEFGVLELEEISIVDELGTSLVVDESSITTNGTMQGNGAFLFLVTDSQIAFCIDSPVKYVRIRAKWRLLSQAELEKHLSPTLPNGA